MTSKPAVIAITSGALPTARAIEAVIDADLYVRRGLPDAPQNSIAFDDTADTLRSLFLANRAVIGVCASGILIRALASVIASKRDEPPVLAVSEDGAAVVPLLGGHRGANALAARIADHLEVLPAVTTAGDRRLGVALDAPPDGWRLARGVDAKPVMAALISGADCTVHGDADWLPPLLALPHVTHHPGAPAAPIVIQVDGLEPLIYRQQTLMLGVGAARGCPPDEMIALAGRTLADNGRSEDEVAAVVSLDLKSDEHAVHALARHLDVPAQFFSAETLEAMTPRLANPSNVVFAEVGCHGVAEGAALAAAGAGATLAIEKQKSANATCAAADLSDSAALSRARPRGRLSLIGIGPGDAKQRTPEASRLIAEAETVVGYSLYLDLLGGAIAGKARHDFPLGGEEDRCRFALEAAGNGRDVALICSGDSGIYAMGALVYELLDRAADAGGVSAEARRAEIISAPGITALQAASANVGALIGHDFCAISLSDLLTPRDDIIARVEAAAAGDFVIAFYNPVSRKRRSLFAEACKILGNHRPAETPVLLASNLGRPEQQLRARTLASVTTDEVDMLTIVLVGASATRAFRTGDTGAGANGTVMYTPRGYARKRDAAE